MKKIVLMTMIFNTLLSGAVLTEDLAAADIHGFLSQGYIKTDHNNYFTDTEKGSFEFHEIGINFGTKLAPRFRAGIQLFAHDFGDIGNDEIQIDWAHVDYRLNEMLGVRLGRIKTPLGLYNETRDIDAVRAHVLLPQSVYMEHYRRIMIATNGLGIYGILNANILGKVRYQLQGGNIDIGKDSGLEKRWQSDVGPWAVDVDISASNAIAGKIAWESPRNGFKLIFSTLRHALSIDTRFVNNFVLEADVKVANFEILSAEYTWQALTLKAEHLFFIRTVAMDQINLRLNQTSEGYYGGMSYRFFSWLETGAYYSEFYYQKGDKTGEESLELYRQIFVGRSQGAIQFYQKDTCVAVSFDIHSNWVIKLEGHKMSGVSSLFDMDNYDDDGTLDLEKDWFLFASKVTYNF